MLAGRAHTQRGWLSPGAKSLLKGKKARQYGKVGDALEACKEEEKKQIKLKK